jgi:hypothetical protein
MGLTYARTRTLLPGLECRCKTRYGQSRRDWRRDTLLTTADGSRACGSGAARWRGACRAESTRCSRSVARLENADVTIVCWNRTHAWRWPLLTKVTSWRRAGQFLAGLYQSRRRIRGSSRLTWPASSRNAPVDFLERGKELTTIDDDALSDDEAGVLAAQQRTEGTDVLGVAQFESGDAYLGDPLVCFLFVGRSVLL